MRVRITEYLDIELETERWHCNRCGCDLGPARANYKRSCRVYERNPLEVYRPLVAGSPSFAPDPDWCRIIEFYCPSCGTMLETEYLPPGHAITHDIELDIEALRERSRSDSE